MWPGTLFEVACQILVLVGLLRIVDLVVAFYAPLRISCKRRSISLSAVSKRVSMPAFFVFFRWVPDALCHVLVVRDNI